MFFDSSSTPVKVDSDAIQMTKAELKSIKCSDSSTGAVFQTLSPCDAPQCWRLPLRFSGFVIRQGGAAAHYARMRVHAMQ